MVSLTLLSFVPHISFENKSAPLTPDWPAAKVTDSSDKCVAEPSKIWLVATFPYS